MEASSLFLNIDKKVQRAAGAAESVKYMRANSRAMVACLAEVVEPLEKLKTLKMDFTSRAPGALGRLDSAAKRALDLLERLSKPRSKLYMVLKAKWLVLKFQEVWAALFRSMEELPSVVQPPSADFSRQVEAACYQLSHARFVGSCTTDRLARRVAREVRGRHEGRRPDDEAMAEIVRYLGLLGAEELQREEAALEGERAAADAAGDPREAAMLKDLVQLLADIGKFVTHRGAAWAAAAAGAAPAAPPPELLCPLAMELMADPVIVASTGRTFERRFIARWLEEGHAGCPLTGRPLSWRDVSPNYTVKALVANWCEATGRPAPPEPDASAVAAWYSAFPCSSSSSAGDGNGASGEGPRSGGPLEGEEASPAQAISVDEDHPPCPCSVGLETTEAPGCSGTCAARPLPRDAGPPNGPRQQVLESDTGISRGSAGGGPGNLERGTLEEALAAAAAACSTDSRAASGAVAGTAGEVDTGGQGAPRPVGRAAAAQQAPNGDVAPSAKTRQRPPTLALGKMSNRGWGGGGLLPRRGPGSSPNLRAGTLSPGTSPHGPGLSPAVSPEGAAASPLLGLRAGGLSLYQGLNLSPEKVHSAHLAAAAGSHKGSPIGSSRLSPRSPPPWGPPGGKRQVCEALPPGPWCNAAAAPWLEREGGGGAAAPLGLASPLLPSSGSLNQGLLDARSDSGGEAALLASPCGSSASPSHSSGFPPPPGGGGGLHTHPVSLVPASGAEDVAFTDAELGAVLDDLACGSPMWQLSAAERLRYWTKDSPGNRARVAAAGCIAPLAALLPSLDPQVAEQAVTALLNISIADEAKAEIARPATVERIIGVLRHGTDAARANSAAAIFSLSVADASKALIGRAGAVPPLLALLADGTHRGRKDACTALFNLSICPENKEVIVHAGGVEQLVGLLQQPEARMEDKAVAVLASLAAAPEGRAAIARTGGIQALVDLLESGSQRGKENAAAALLQLSGNSLEHRALILQEGAIPPLVALSHNGTPRAQEKAATLLKHFREHRDSGSSTA